MTGNIVRRIDDLVPVNNVIVSVSNKAGLDGLIAGLLKANPAVRFYSTGGTFSAIQKILGPGRSAGNLVAVSDYTGQPETQGGLVKTLDFKIYLGLLTEKYNVSHRGDLERTGATAMDMVVVNLYPFRETVAKEGVRVEEARANIDIGGPCMIRAAAKNYLRVASLVDPADYGWVLERMGTLGGKLDLESRFRLARRAFAHTASYDAAIAAYLEKAPEADAAACYELADR